MQASVVVLNRNYEYWSEASVHKVLKWLTQDKIEIVVADESAEIGSVEFRIKMPLVVRLLKFVGYKPRSETVQFSPEAVFQRDDNFCQYWHKDEQGRRFKYKCNTEDRTIDHVVPFSRGGQKTFENCVCCCREHNELVKRNKTPAEAGLELVKRPVEPRRDRNDYVTIRFAYNPRKSSHNVFLKWYRGGV